MARLSPVLGLAGVLATGLGSILVTLWPKTPLWAWVVLEKADEMSTSPIMFGFGWPMLSFACL